MHIRVMLAIAGNLRFINITASIYYECKYLLGLIKWELGIAGVCYDGVRVKENEQEPAE
jgi:hypothetical protein